MDHQTEAQVSQVSAHKLDHIPNAELRLQQDNR
jgi:hypothetical protein